jgi:hypothetical protein
MSRLGAIAQLEEHLHGMQKVRGSSPRRSTIFRTNITALRVNIRDLMAFLTDQLGRSSADLALLGVAGA